MFLRHRLIGLWVVLEMMASSALLAPAVSKGATDEILWSADMETGDMTQWYAPATEAGGGKRFQQTMVDLPVGRWVHIETYLKQATDFSGRIMVWQDGTQIFDEDNIKTKYPDGDDQWSVNLYSDGLSPSPSVLYIDDATIATYRVGLSKSAVTPSHRDTASSLLSSADLQRAPGPGPRRPWQAGQN